MKTNIARQLVAQGRRYVQQITKARASAGRYLDKRRLDRRR